MMNLYQKAWMVILALAAAMPAAASDQIPGAPQEGPVALVGGTVHTVAGPVLHGAAVLFENGKIVSVGLVDRFPDGTRVIEIPGKHVYPGLIAANTTVGLVEIGSVRATQDFRETGSINPGVRAETAFNPDSEVIPVTRANGIAIVQSVPQGGVIAGLSAMMMLDGWTWEDMTLNAPAGLHVNWPSLDVNRADAPDSKRAVEKRLDDLKGFFADARAYWDAKRAGGNGGYPPMETDVGYEAMGPVLDGEVPVIVNAQSAAEIESAVLWAAAEGIELVIDGGRGAWRVADRLREHDVPVILRGTQTLSFRPWEPHDTAYTLPLKLHEAGVRFCVSHPDYQNARNLPYHAGSAAAYGLPRDEALKSVTLYPARILGIGDRAGSVEPGKDATLIVTDGDPLEVRTNVERMFIQGREVDLTSRHTDLYEKYKIKYARMEED